MRHDCGETEVDTFDRLAAIMASTSASSSSCLPPPGKEVIDLCSDNEDPACTSASNLEGAPPGKEVIDLCSDNEDPACTSASNLEGAVALHFGAQASSPASHTASRMSEAALMREEDRQLEMVQEGVSLSLQAPSVRGLSAAACTSASSSAAAGCREELHATCFTTTTTPSAERRAPWQRCRLDDEDDIRFRSQVYRFRIRMQEYFFSYYLLCDSTVVSYLREAVSTDRGPGKVLAEVLAACEQDLSIVQRLV